MAVTKPMASGSEPEGLDHLRQPKAYAVEPDCAAEIDEAQHQHARSSEGVPEIGITRVPRGLGFSRKDRFERVPLLAREPVCVVGPVVEKKECDDSERHGGQTLENEQPVPAFESAESVQLEERAGYRPSHHRCDRYCQHEQGDDARPLARGEPIGEIKDDAGEEARFSHAEQEAHHVEARLAADQGHGGGDDAPAYHDAGDPDACTEMLEREVARDLEQEIAGEEDAGAGAEHRRREAEILVHGECGEADIHPVEEIHRVAENQERQEAARGLGDGAPCRFILLHRSSALPSPTLITGSVAPVMGVSSPRQAN